MIEVLYYNDSYITNGEEGEQGGGGLHGEAALIGEEVVQEDQRHTPRQTAGQPLHEDNYTRWSRQHLQLHA